MSKPAIREVEFFTDGQLVKTVTDAETARAIGTYKDVYNKIQSFDISTQSGPSNRPGFVREVYFAQSHRLKIVCIKEFLPDVPEILNGARYECGILNKKSDKLEVVKKNEFERFSGGVPMLYYKLFRGRIK